jgi:hypothetical protein
MVDLSILRTAEEAILRLPAAAILASLASTCRRHQADPQVYLTQLLLNLPAWPIRDLDAWLPDQWKLRNAACGATLNRQD